MQVNRQIETIEDKTETIEDRLQVLSLWVTIYLQKAVFVCLFGAVSSPFLGDNPRQKSPISVPNSRSFKLLRPYIKENEVVSKLPHFSFSGERGL